MKILLINVTYKRGSTGNIVYSLKKDYEELGHEVFAIYGRKDKIKEKNVYKGGFELESKIHHFFSLFSGNMFGGMPFSTHRIKHLIKKINPDVIHLHCLNGYFVNIYKLLDFLKAYGKRVVLTNHAEFMYTGGCAYIDGCEHYKEECVNCERVSNINGKYSRNTMHKNFLKMKKSLQNFDNLVITGVSPWITKQANDSEIFKDKNVVSIINGINQNFCKNLSENDPYKDLKEQGFCVVFSIIPNFYDYIKGGHYLYKIAGLLKNKKIHFIIAGDKGKKLTNVTYLGNVANSELCNYYHYADKTLLLSKRESFSLVVAESLVCGTPVIGFEAGGPETISISEFSKFVAQGNVEEICEFLTFYKFNFEKSFISKKAMEKFSTKKVALEYLKIYG